MSTPARIMFYDTETSGMPLWDKPSKDPGQPHILQVCALLVDAETRRVLQSIDLTVRPDGWVIDPEAEGVHGISMEYALEVGVPETTALLALYEIWQRADLRVGHVESFDARMVRIALKRHGWGDRLADAWKEGRAECTAALSKADVRPEGRGRGPKLVEAYSHYFNDELQDAHSARADTEACMAIYFAIKDRSGAADRRAQRPKTPRG